MSTTTKVINNEGKTQGKKQKKQDYFIKPLTNTQLGSAIRNTELPNQL
jgi:hypothetical protein